MKIVVVYATAGAGHKKAANVIADHIRRSGDCHTVLCSDIVSHSSWFFRFIYFWGYDFLVNHCQWLWSLFFSCTSRPAFRPFFARLSTSIHYRNTQAFARFLIGERPDVVVSTHFLSSDIVAHLKANSRLQARLITVITDFGVHPWWISEKTDMYCVASDITKQMLLGKGAEPQKICVTGIPTDPKFSRAHDRGQICARLHIDSGKKIVLVVTGSFGIGPIEDIAARLHQDYVVLAVCARNQRLFNRLTARAYPHTLVFGFIDFIDDLMAISDVIITKPGGLTISELLCMDCIPLFIAAIPGQESVNVSVLQSAGIGQSVSSIRDIKNQVSACIRNAPRIKDSIQKFKQKNSVSLIYDLICAGSTGSAR